MKKISTQQWPLFSILLLTLLSGRGAAQSAAPVLDTSGQELQAGIPYHITPLFAGGGLTMLDARNRTCPLDVVQLQPEVLRGLPVTFHPANLSETVVRVSTDHNFQFEAVTVCWTSNVWTLAFDNSVLRFFITTGGELGNPGRWTLSNWFRIEAVGIGYKLVFCPTVCETCRPVCGDLAILYDRSLRRLVMAVADEGPFLVVFEKAESVNGTMPAGGWVE